MESKRTFENRSKAMIKRLFPLLNWLPSYKWKGYFFYDLIAGFTIACVCVPQSLAFANLATVDLIYGLNTACFSSFVYAVFGTATQSAFGPVAIGSMLTGESISKFDYEKLPFTKEQYAAGLTVAIGAFYLIMFILRLGVLTVMFKKPFVSGFIMACALHIFIKSIKQMFGLHIKFVYGNFNFYFNLIELCSKLGDTHVPTLIVSAIVMSIFYINMLVLSPYLKRYTKFVLPIETIVMIGSMLFSYFLKFSDMGIAVVGTLPKGLPSFVPPTYDSFIFAISEAVPIALINYATTTSMTILFNPNLDREQDILAMALSNLLCGSFQCITIGNSMMRTMIAVNLGIKTLLASMISTFFMLLIILFAGPMFKPLPMNILACIITTAVTKILYERILDIIKFRKSFQDLFIFFTTFIATLMLDVSIGLIVGVTLSLRTILDGVVKEQAKKDEEKKTEEENTLLPK